MVEHNSLGINVRNFFKGITAYLDSFPLLLLSFFSSSQFVIVGSPNWLINYLLQTDLEVCWIPLATELDFIWRSKAECNTASV